MSLQGETAIGPGPELNLEAVKWMTVNVDAHIINQSINQSNFICIAHIHKPQLHRWLIVKHRKREQTIGQMKSLEAISSNHTKRLQISIVLIPIMRWNLKNQQKRFQRVKGVAPTLLLIVETKNFAVVVVTVEVLIIIIIIIIIITSIKVLYNKQYAIHKQSE